ncbi:N-6 DNA methylase [Bacteroides caecimuris]|uniref:N-6 DNA methylase n=1 Tax=Bacteroides caecimuris TaxID=1796613 RepID=UPI0025B76F8D|nr:N-6 DNA methylase [Bacteroides caecimuris]
MLNTNSTSAAQSLNIANVLLSAKWQKVADADYGHVFTPDYFASDWDSIYVNPSDLKLESVSKGMRKLVAPTLLITSEKAQMAYILASEDEPVYIPSEFLRDKDFGYLLAFTISPEVSPEYMFYVCKFNLWNRLLLNRIGTNDYCPSWNSVGIANYDPQHGEIIITPEDIIRSLGEISIHSIAQQKELVKTAKEQEAIVEEARFNVSDLANHYLFFAHQGGIFNKSGLGLLAEVYRIAAGNWAKPEVLNILKEYEFKKDILSQEELTFLSKHLSEVFALVISSNGITFHPSDGFVQPQEVTDFMCKMASFPENVTVYNPFAGADSYAIALPNHVVGEEISSTTWALGQIRLFANFADKRADITLGDSFESIRSSEKFKAIITSPVYLKEEGHEISDIVKMLYDKLDDGGKLACIVSANFLFRKDDKVRAVRETLIKDKAISSIVMLPSNIFTGSSIAQAAIVLTKGVKNDEILFGDASEHTRFAKSVYRATTFDLESFMDAFEADIEDTQEGYEPCEDQTGIAVPYEKLVGSELTPSLYLAPKPKNGIPLSELAEEVPELRGKDISAEYFLTGSSIPAAMHRKPFAPVKVEDGKVSTAKKHVQVPENAVILAIVSGHIRTVYTEGFSGKVAFPAGFIKVMKPINGISAKYLAAVLSTKIVADQIKAQTVGATIPRLNKLDLNRILVPVHGSVEEREQLIAEVLSSEMSDLESELQETLESQKREVRSTRHAMIQTLSALSANWEQLKMFSNDHADGIKLSDKVGRINPISVKDLMGSIEYAISTLQRQVEALRLEKFDWGQEVAINPYKVINDYITSHSTPMIRMINKGTDNVADFPYFDDETGEAKHHHTDAADIFYAPEKLVERIFNNIVANAKAHGFTADSTNNEIWFDWKSENGGIVITIANNGRPLKDGVSGEDVLMRGFSTALNENDSDGKLHSGQGGFEIKSLMEGLGTVEVISQPEAEFPVIYKLTFEKTNFETINLFED